MKKHILKIRFDRSYKSNPLNQICLIQTYYENLRIDELIGSLQTFGMNLDGAKQNAKSEKSIALQVTDAVSIGHSITIEELQEQIILYAQNFNRALRSSPEDSSLKPPIQVLRKNINEWLSKKRLKRKRIKESSATSVTELGSHCSRSFSSRV